MSVQENDDNEECIHFNKPVMFSLNWSLSFQEAELKLKDSCARITLISRRCTRRLGTMSKNASFL